MRRVTRVACVTRWRADTYLVNNVRGMTRTAMQRPLLQPDTPVFRNNDSSSERFKRGLTMDDARIFRPTSFFSEARGVALERCEKYKI